MIFTFSKHPIKHLIEDHFGLFTGVQKIVAIYANTNNEINGIAKSSAETNELNLLDFISDIHKIRNEKGAFSWHEESNLPFKIRQAGVFQQEIFAELEKTVLLIKIDSELDGKKDLLFVYFDKKLDSLELNNGNKNKLNGEVKSYIAKSLHNSIISILKNAKTNQSVLTDSLNPGTQHIISSYNKLKESHQDLHNKYKTTFTKLIKSLFYKHINKDKHRILLSNGTINKLIEFKGDYSDLELIIKNTSDYLGSLYTYKLPKELLIEEFFINTDIDLTNENTEINRYTKTIILLDSLNNSIKTVMSKNMNPTSTNVGNAMTKPITAPAISDALKNHKTKILSLFERYPDRWSELKKFFKPIQNLNTYNKFLKSAN